MRTKDIDATAVTAIVVDVVVRDRDGKPVTDLKPTDFELYEEKVLQDVGSFTPVNRPDPAAATPAAPVAPTPARRRAAVTQAPQVIALIFDRLTPDAKALAHKAAINYIGQGATANNVVGVFGIDLSLIFYQSFTRDGDAAAQGGRGGGGPRHVGLPEQPRERRQARRRLRRPPRPRSTRGRPPPDRAAGVDAAAAANAQFASMTNRIAQQFTLLEADEEGYSTANALLAVVSAMRAIPGRKSVIFFSEGLSITTNVKQRFTSVIATANRANVSIYPMDAAGLRTESTLTATREGVQGASSRRMNAEPDEPAQRSADDRGARNQRGPPERRPAQRARPARRPDRRLPDRQQQRPARRLRQDRHGHAALLRADLRAEEHQLRRQVPRRSTSR